MCVFKNFNLFLYISITLLLFACAPITVDVSDYRIKAKNIAEPLTSNITLSSQNLRFTHRATGNTDGHSNVGHDFSSLNSGYVNQINRALFTAQNPSTNNSHKAVLKLEAIDMVQFIGEGFVDIDIDEHIIAKWQLYNSKLSERFFSFEISGHAAGKQGWGSDIVPNARDRFGRAYQNLLDNTLIAFANSDDLKQFSLITNIYLDPQAGADSARQILSNTSTSDYETILESIRSVAVKRGSVELFNFCRKEIDSREIKSIRDESALFHVALQSDAFNRSMVNSILDRMTDLEILSDQGMTPLEASLDNGLQSLAVELIKAGARPTLKLAGDTYISAEVSFALIGDLLNANAPHKESVNHAIRLYKQAIKESTNAIENNEASIFARNVANIIGPFIQHSMAMAEAKAEANVFGVGVSVYSPAQYNTNDPKQAIEYLQDRVNHCKQRIDALKNMM